ncbi:alpha/beta-hydrolase [Calocera viscosa TUFC12733]|uniref:Alpha/beta-hydrolase n=1 Tax=Calocera viscosa (strain TUFC12733) TaxID=1330018 RepID=A0A167JT29_CALVF|nr:alpha/beta-hydrolase [Calocera viscosa TUFC12733]
MAFSWAIADLGVLMSEDEPVSLCYGDTAPGRTDTQPYTTIIALHGAGFNSNIWTPWIPYLPSEYRVIAVNRRGYAGSSSVHKSQNRMPSDTEAFGRHFLDKLAFIKFVVDLVRGSSESCEEPPKIVLLGWSKGCAYWIALLATLSTSDSLPTSFGLPWSTVEPYITVVRDHVRSVILFEPPEWIVGIPLNIPVSDGTLDTSSSILLEASVDDMTILAHDLRSWNGTDFKEREDVATKALCKVPSFLGMGIVYCTTGIGLEGSLWMIDRLDGQRNTTSRAIQGGNHFVMATDPKEFNDAVIGCVQELAVKVDNFV